MSLNFSDECFQHGMAVAENRGETGQARDAVWANRQSLAGQNPLLFTPDAADAAGPW